MDSELPTGKDYTILMIKLEVKTVEYLLKYFRIASGVNKKSNYEMRATCEGILDYDTSEVYQTRLI